jgi:hypothetical protein
MQFCSKRRNIVGGQPAHEDGSQNVLKINQNVFLIESEVREVFPKLSADFVTPGEKSLTENVQFLQDAHVERTFPCLHS